MESQRIAFIGLGHMGRPMALNLLKAGIAVNVYNRSPDKAQALHASGAVVCDSIGQACTNAGIVITMLANDEALGEVTRGPGGLLQSMSAGTVHCSMSTVSPRLASELAKEHERHGSHYLAGPVFGRPEAAEAAKLVVVAAGSATAKDALKPAFAAMARAVYDFGEEPAKANVVKLVGNFMLMSAVKTMGEAYSLGASGGVDAARLAEFFGETLFATPVYQNYGAAIAKGTATRGGFKLALARKDLNLARDFAGEHQMTLPIADLLASAMTEKIENGRGDEDLSSLGF